jgi:hypothetical protein
MLNEIKNKFVAVICNTLQLFHKWDHVEFLGDYVSVADRTFECDENGNYPSELTVMVGKLDMSMPYNVDPEATVHIHPKGIDVYYHDTREEVNITSSHINPNIMPGDGRDIFMWVRLAPHLVEAYRYAFKPETDKDAEGGEADASSRHGSARRSDS